MGGLNVGKEYISRDPYIGFWRDTHLRLEGEIVQTLHAIFMLDWEYVSNEVLMIKRSTIPRFPWKEEAFIKLSRQALT